MERTGARRQARLVRMVLASPACQPSTIVVVPIFSMVVEASLGILLVRTVAEAIQRTVAARALLLRDH
jgi:hypothetical protein